MGLTHELLEFIANTWRDGESRNMHNSGSIYLKVFETYEDASKLEAPNHSR